MLADAPVPLLIAAFVGIALGAPLLAGVLFRMARAALGIPHLPVSTGYYVFATLLGGGLAGAGVLAGVLAAALPDWQTVRTPLGVVRCRGGAVRFTPAPPGPAEAAAGCLVEVELLELHPWLAFLELGLRARVSRLGDRARPTQAPAWRALPRPLGLPPGAARPSVLVLGDGDGGAVEASYAGARLVRPGVSPP